MIYMYGTIMQVGGWVLLPDKSAAASQRLELMLEVKKGCSPA